MTNMFEEKKKIYEKVPDIVYDIPDGFYTFVDEDHVRISIAAEGNSPRLSPALCLIACFML